MLGIIANLNGIHKEIVLDRTRLSNIEVTRS